MADEPGGVEVNTMIRRISAAVFPPFLLLASAIQGAAMSDDLDALNKVLPPAIAGWTKALPPARYAPHTLSAYIDGGAELYLSYNFQAALAVKYKGAGEEEIAVDIFEMRSSSDAFGVFAHSRESVDSAVGQGSEYAAGLLTFWKDRYYVSILAYPETAAKREAVFSLGRTIAGAIPREGALPPILGLLPAENLAPESVHFFHHYIWLNSFYFVSNENVLDIGPDTPAVLAKYKQGGGSMFLLVVLYPSDTRAGAAAALFRRSVLGGADGPCELKPGRWTGLERRGGRVAVIFGAPDQAAIRGLFGKIKE
jgi:hypothetical protein